MSKLKYCSVIWSCETKIYIPIYKKIAKNILNIMDFIRTLCHMKYYINCTKFVLYVEYICKIVN